MATKQFSGRAPKGALTGYSRAPVMRNLQRSSRRLMGQVPKAPNPYAQARRLVIRSLGRATQKNRPY